MPNESDLLTIAQDRPFTAPEVAALSECHRCPHHNVLLAYLDAVVAVQTKGTIGNPNCTSMVKLHQAQGVCWAVDMMRQDLTELDEAHVRNVEKKKPLDKRPRKV